MSGFARIALAATALAATIQAVAPPAQQPLTDPKTAVVDSQKLQDLVRIDNLSRRADELYRIAQLSEPDFHHPTRVVGSKGAPVPGLVPLFGSRH